MDKEPGSLKGFHGTTVDDAQRFVEQGFDTVSKTAFFAGEAALSTALHYANDRVELARYRGEKRQPALIEADLPYPGYDVPDDAKIIGIPPEKAGEIVITNVLSGKDFDILYESYGRP